MAVDARQIIPHSCLLEEFSRIQLAGIARQIPLSRPSLNFGAVPDFLRICSNGTQAGRSLRADRTGPPRTPGIPRVFWALRILAPSAWRGPLRMQVFLHVQAPRCMQSPPSMEGTPLIQGSRRTQGATPVQTPLPMQLPPRVQAPPDIQVPPRIQRPLRMQRLSRVQELPRIQGPPHVQGAPCRRPPGVRAPPRRQRE